MLLQSCLSCGWCSRAQMTTKVYSRAPFPSITFELSERANECLEFTASRNLQAGFGWRKILSAPWFGEGSHSGSSAECRWSVSSRPVFPSRRENSAIPQMVGLQATCRLTIFASVTAAVRGLWFPPRFLRQTWTETVAIAHIQGSFKRGVFRTCATLIEKRRTTWDERAKSGRRDRTHRFLTERVGGDGRISQLS